MAKVTKKVEGFVKLQVAAGQATPAPPVGPALGQKGINIKEFCDKFNAQTKNLEGVKPGTKLPVVIKVFNDRSFEFITKTVPATTMILEAIGLPKGSPVPHTQKVGKIKRSQLEKIARYKMPDLNAGSIEAAIRTLAGSARSMGIDMVEG